MKSSTSHDAKGNQAPASAESVPELRIITMILRIHDGKSYYRVQYRSLDGTTKTKLVSRELFRTPTKVADILVGSDANLLDPVASVKAALLGAKSVPYLEMTWRTGWHGHQDFVYPTETFGWRSGRLFTMPARTLTRPWGCKAGPWPAWADGLRDACRFSDYALFTASIAAGSSLLDIVQAGTREPSSIFMAWRHANAVCSRRKARQERH